MTIRNSIRKTRPEEELRIALIELDFSFESREIDAVKNMWLTGKGIRYMSEYLGRQVDEVFLILLDMSRRGEIEERINGDGILAK